MKKKWNLLHASRGFFCLLMILFNAHHMGVQFWKSGPFGWDTPVRSGAMDYFLILSGFVLFHTYQHRIGDFAAARHFFRNRLFRIYPTYWYIFIPMVPFAAFFTGEKLELADYIRSFFLMPISNGVNPPASVLSYFLLFYAVFGLVLLVGKGRGTVLLSLWFMIILIHFTHGIFEGHSVLAFVFSKYHLYFFAGGFIAYLVKKIEIPYPQVLVGAGLAGLVLTWFNKVKGWVPIDELYEFGIPAATVLFGLALLESGRERVIPGWINFLGRASYTLFLTHYPVLALLYQGYTEAGLTRMISPAATTMLMAFLAAAIGCLLYLIVEKPLLNFLLQNRKKPASVTG
ncbi:acyltransferase family protein [Salinithrix halophila]|uniref:Acyltransferase family protein n=1 Tax=Salinithrix halophila TaxID=1485204 RepID=A0ABV8JGY0_9BACL